MRRRIVAAALAGLVVLAVAVGVFLRESMAAEDGAALRSGNGSPSPAQVDSATVVIQGTLSGTALRGIGPAGEGRTLLAVLRGRDRTVCEDLGRQLRELTRAAGESSSLVVLTDPASVEAYGVFLRRERIRGRIVSVSPDSVLVGTALPSPAVLVWKGGNDVTGVAHPERFPNLRIHSFATELDSLLYDPAPPMAGT